MKRFVSLFFCALFLLSGPAAFAAYDVNQAANSVVRVALIEGDYCYGYGSAFVVGHAGGSTYLVTNRHVVYDEWGDLSLEIQKQYTYVLLDDVGDIKLPVSDIILLSTDVNLSYDYDDGLDLAFIRVDTGLSNRKALPLLSSASASRGDRIYAAGFPYVADWGMNAWKLPSSEKDVTITSGSITNTSNTYGHKDIKYLQIDAVLHGGNSGGPLINENGAVIGVNTLSWGEGTNASIHIDYIINECDRLGIPYTLYSNNFFLEYWWIFAIGGGVVIIAVVLVIVLATRKPAAVRQPAGVPYGAPVGAPYGAPVGAPYGAPAGAPAGGPPRLIGVNGSFAGSTFPVSGVIAIGRDARQCQVVYPGDTQGISSLHCSLAAQPGGVVLTDRGSSYGTFLADGRKLGPNESVMLRPGDTFHLADRKNEFKIV